MKSEGFNDRKELILICLFEEAQILNLATPQVSL
jgi:hypothetical protein